MPKVKITEIDNTGSPTLNPITNVVYIPGRAGIKTKPLMCNTLDNLNGYLKDTSLALEEDLSFKLARRCLQLGLQVLYQGFLGNDSEITWTLGNYSASIITNSETEIKTIVVSGEKFNFSDTKLTTTKKYRVTHASDPETHSNEYLEFNIINGKCEIKISNLILSEGDSVAVADFKLFGDASYGSRTGDEIQTILFDYVDNKVGYNWLGVAGGGITIDSDDWDKLSDKALYNIRFLTSGAYAQGQYADMIACAEKRKDCIALLDHSSDLKDVASIRAELGTNPNKYAAAFTPWFTSNVSDFGSALIPPSFGYLFAYARSIQSNPDWYAVAGTFRGNIPELKEVEVEYTTAEIEMLQGRAADHEVELDDEEDNIGIAINPIAYIRGFGYLIWGNRTLVNNEGYTKATSFLNVRQLCCDIVKTLYSAARRYTFEQNSDTLWLNFKYQIQPLLDRMVSGNGIASYTFERLATIAKARLKARLVITPIEGVEDFELELVLEDSLEVIE